MKIQMEIKTDVIVFNHGAWDLLSSRGRWKDITSRGICDHFKG